MKPEKQMEERVQANIETHTVICENIQVIVILHIMNKIRKHLH